MKFPELEPSLPRKTTPRSGYYSSGSTGFPKGCVHLHHDMVVCAELYAKNILKITENDRFFSVAKFFFAYGLGNGLYLLSPRRDQSFCAGIAISAEHILRDRKAQAGRCSFPSFKLLNALSYQREGGPDFDLSNVVTRFPLVRPWPRRFFHRFKERLTLDSGCHRFDGGVAHVHRQPSGSGEAWIERAESCRATKRASPTKMGRMSPTVRWQPPH